MDYILTLDENISGCFFFIIFFAVFFFTVFSCSSSSFVVLFPPCSHILPSTLFFSFSLQKKLSSYYSYSCIHSPAFYIHITLLLILISLVSFIFLAFPNQPLTLTSPLTYSRWPHLSYYIFSTSPFHIGLQHSPTITLPLISLTHPLPHPDFPSLHTLPFMCVSVLFLEAYEARIESRFRP